MSYPTENTVVVKVEDIDKLHKALKENDDIYGWIENVVEVYKNDALAIFIFDCNGDPMAVNENVDYLLLETNYLEDEEICTEVFDLKKKTYKQSRFHANYWIKKWIGLEEFEKIEDSLAYSM